MSNEVILKIQNQLASIQGDVDDDSKAVAGANFGKSISIRGGVFRKIANGKEVAKIEDRSMEVIFVKMAHNPSRMYYDKNFQEDAKISPVCWSSDGKTPDLKVEAPQSTSCATCRQSTSGTGNQGIGTACRLSWRTAVVLPQDPSGDVMRLVLPATSVFGKEVNGKWPFKAYVQMLVSNNISANRVITKMSFDTDAPQPKLLFSPTGAVSPQDIPKVKVQSDSAAAEGAIEMAIFKRREEAAIEAVAAPTPPEVEAVPEPVLRKTEPEKKATDEVPDILRKWAPKK